MDSATTVPSPMMKEEKSKSLMERGDGDGDSKDGDSKDGDGESRTAEAGAA